MKRKFALYCMWVHYHSGKTFRYTLAPAGRDPLETKLHCSEVLGGMEEDSELFFGAFRPRREQSPSSSYLAH